MSNEVQTANAGADQKPVVKNISNSELIAMRYRSMSDAPKVQNTPKEQQQETKEVAHDDVEVPKEEVRQEEPAPIPTEPDVKEEQRVLSKDVDLDSMSESELRELSQKLGSKAVARYGELTAKRKAAEEQLEALKADIAKRSSNQLEATVKDNPYANIDNATDLKSKYQEVTEVIDWSEDLLEKGEDLGADDVLTNVNGKDYSKREIKDALRKARKAKEIYLPDQDKQIKIGEDRKSFKEHLMKQAKSELPWL